MSPRTHDVLLKCNWVKVAKCCQSIPTFPCSAWIRYCCQAAAVWTLGAVAHQYDPYDNQISCDGWPAGPHPASVVVSELSSFLRCA